jgi:uncharacterized heparinase superfamily protein
MITYATRLYRTVVYLKPVQIYGRVVYKLRRPKPRFGDPPPRRGVDGVWNVPAGKRQSLFGANRLRFLGCDGVVGSAGDWNRPDRDKLWLYNLHYFDDLTACDAADRNRWHRDLVGRWIVENPVGVGNGWEPYPLSLRIVNWIKWALAGAQLEPSWLESLAIQIRWLEDRLEWHLLGNHLLANAKALVFAGLFFVDPQAARWLERGLSILRPQLREQILDDGGHFELSPMYHAIILEDILDLINLAGAFPGTIPETVIAEWRSISDKMRRWLACMTHPDGRIAFFNDAAFGIAAERATLDAYAERLGLSRVLDPQEGVTKLERSGYIRLQCKGAVALLDVASVGPDYLPGHAHADTLSFELSIARDRIIVNGGTSTYAPGLQRQCERSTLAHSTVEIDGEDSSEVWASFRVGRRARVAGLSVQEEPELLVSCCHDGYARLRGRPVHKREWRLAQGCLRVRDSVPGGAGRASARFHLGPDVDEADCPGAGNSGWLRRGREQTIIWRTSVPAKLEKSQWHPEFGRTIGTRCLTVPFTREVIETEVAW